MDLSPARVRGGGAENRADERHEFSRSSENRGGGAWNRLALHGVRGADGVQCEQMSGAMDLSSAQVRGGGAWNRLALHGVRGADGVQCEQMSGAMDLSSRVPEP